MRLEALLRAHSYMKIERPPELWEADTEDWRFVPLLGEIIAAALAGGAALEELTLNASNVVVEPPPDDGEEPSPPLPGEYVAITVRGATDLGPDDIWHPAAPRRPGLLARLHPRLETSGARFAYVRRAPPQGSLTVFLRRLVQRTDIVAFEPSMAAACERILKALPDWFGIPAANEAYLESLPRLTTFVARLDGTPVGFIALERHFPESAENHVLAVHPEHHRRGIGRELVRHAEQWLRSQGVEMFHVKTLGPSEPYAPYARTREFYMAMGFRPLFETTALWGRENPALILAKAL